jgi:hypothetical protein
MSVFSRKELAMHVSRWSMLLGVVSLVAGCAAPAAAPTSAPAAPAAAPTSARAAPAATQPPAAAAPTPTTAAAAAAKPAASVVAAATPAPTTAAAAKPAASPAAAAGGATAGSLKGVCPDTIVFQTNWWPEADHGLFYQLIGPNGKLDTNKNTYSGPIGDTGVTGEVRAGGPAIGFQSVTAQMYQDDSILLGFVGTDEQIGASANQPTVAVLAWYAKNPQVFFWGNPDWNFSSVADIGKADAQVLAFESATYLDVFEGKGLLKKSQVDTSYTGDPSRFVAADGNIVSQGFVTSEPFIYEHEVKEWMKPVKFLLMDKEFPVYQNAVAVRADKLAANKGCLQKLIPMLQQAAVDYVKTPGPVNNVLVDFTSKIKGGTQISAPGAADAVKKMLDLGIIGNGADGVYGSFDSARVKTLIDDVVPVFSSRGKPAKEGLAPADLFTNEFLDKSIKL